MGEIIPFVFKDGEGETEIRTLSKGADPWFVAVDVCRVLGLANATMALKALDADEKDTLSIVEGIVGNPIHSIISEPGLYKLIQGSRKPAAKAFDRFVRHNILPAYRRGELISSSCQSDLLAALNGVEIRLGARLERIEGKLDGDRQGFSAATVRGVCEGTAKHNNCECIYCNDIKVVTKYGEKITYELHHVDGNKANNSFENCTIPCPECHKRLTNKKHKDHIPVHRALGIADAFHLKLKQKAAQIRSPGTAVGFWDMRVFVQADMGWGQSRKKRPA